MLKHPLSVIRPLCLAITLGHLFILTAPAIAAPGRQQLWESREQFVALEPSETELFNDQPAELDQLELKRILSSLRLQPAADEPPLPLLTGESITTLAPQLQQALRKATPRQDVTFAVIGLHDALYGLAKQPQVTTGRLFVRNRPCTGASM